MRSLIVKHSVVIAKQKTSVSLEDCFWKRLREIAIDREITLSALIGEIDAARPAKSNLSSACRTYVLADAQERLATLAGAIGMEYPGSKPRRIAPLREHVET